MFQHKISRWCPHNISCITFHIFDGLMEFISSSLWTWRFLVRIYTKHMSLEHELPFAYNGHKENTEGAIIMITKEQEQFVRNHITTEYFDPDKVVNYLSIHTLVGAEIFDLALKPQTKRNIRLVGEGFGFCTVDVETFVKRVPFYFYEPDFEKDQHGDLLSLICGNTRDDIANDFEKVYGALEKLFYRYNINVPEIMGYPISLTGTYGRTDIFFKWVHYLDLCYDLHIDNKYPREFLYEYNRILLLAGESPIVYMPGLVGFNEDFLRHDKEIIIGGEFPCDSSNKPILEWIGVWIENAAYVQATNCYSMSDTPTLEKELHIGLAPDTKIYMPNIYNSSNCGDTWYPIYFGPLVMEFDKDVLKFYRKRIDVTQRALADAVGVQLRTYQKWEKGETIPDGYNLIRLMNYLNIESVQDFVVNTPIYDEGFVKFKSRTMYN